MCIVLLRLLSELFQSVGIYVTGNYVPNRADSQGNCFYAIFSGPLGPEPGDVKPEDYVFAGAIGLINSSRDDMVSELGYIQIMKPFQVCYTWLHVRKLTDSARMYYRMQQEQ